MVRLAPQIQSVAAQLILRDRYETLYGIHDHQVEDPMHPMPLVAMWPQEDASTGSLLDERLEQFADLQVGRVFNCSLNEFLSQPSDVCFKMLEIAAKRKNTEVDTTDALLSRINQASQGTPP